MIEHPPQRNKRALIIGAAAVVLVLIFHFAVSPWIDHWRQVRTSLAAAEEKLALLSGDQKPAAAAKQAALTAAVPAFALPEPEDKQRLLFERKIHEQLKKAGIKAKPLSFLARPKPQPALGLKLLRLQCRGACNFAAALDLIAALNENPYLVAIEELQLKCGAKTREEMDLNLTVSTFVQ